MSDTSFEKPFLLNFPEMNPRSVQVGTLHEVFYFDPGVHSQPETWTWKPDNLPLNGDLVLSFLRESVRFAQEHGREGKHLVAASMMGEDFYSQTSLAIRARLTTVTEPQVSEAPSRQAQQVLLLAWQLEHDSLELREMLDVVQTGWDNLTRDMGLDETDGNQALLLKDSRGEHEEQSIPWRSILESFLFFAPKHAVLTSCRGEVIESLSDMEAGSPEIVPPLLPLSSARLMENGKAVLISHPGWKLAGRTRCPADKPWLEPMRTVLLARCPGCDSTPAQS